MRRGGLDKEDLVFLSQDRTNIAEKLRTSPSLHKLIEGVSLNQYMATALEICGHNQRAHPLKTGEKPDSDHGVKGHMVVLANQEISV
jgi:hypothetical protein